MKAVAIVLYAPGELLPGVSYAPGGKGRRNVSHRIVIDITGLESEFERLLDEMYLTYHYHQTNIPDYHLTKEEQEEEDSLKFIGGGCGGCR